MNRARPLLVFVHGWAFDAGLWQRLRTHLTEWDQATVDFGYTGRPAPWPELGDRSWVAITHSYGTVKTLLRASEKCLGMISINGFPSFCEKEDYLPAVSSRIVGRMIARLGANPEAGIADFRQRCGKHAPPSPPFDLERLRQDLIHLRDADARSALAGLGVPVLQLAATADLIVPHEMSRHAFKQAKHLEQKWLQGGDHLLPWSADAWCAAAIREFLDRTGAA